MATSLSGQQVGSSGTYFDDALRIDYQPMIRKQFSEESVLLNNLEKGEFDSTDARGSFVRITLQKSQHVATGAKPEGYSLPAKNYTRLETSDVYSKSNYGRVEVSGQVMKASRDNKGAAMKALEVEMQAVTSGMRNDINRQLACGNGVGTLALDNGGSQTTTWTLDSLLGIGFTTPSSASHEAAPTKYFIAGMKVDVGDATTQSTIDVDSASVTSVDSATQITGTTITGADDNGYFMREDAYAAEMMGLRGIVDDGGHLDTFQTIQRTGTGNSYWKSSVVDKGSAASPETLQESFMQDAFTLSEKNGGKVGLIFTTFGLRDSYASILQSDKRFVNTTELKGGFKAIDFNGTPVVPDKDCTPYNMYFLDKSTITLFEQSPISWADEDGAVLSRVDGYDAYEAYLYYYANLGASNCVKNACLSYVQ